MATLSLKSSLLWTSLMLVTVAGCFSNAEKEKKGKPTTSTQATAVKETHSALTTKPIPVLCYHAIQNTEKDDSANKKTYSVSPVNFASQIKALADNGYTSITPNELKDFYTNHITLPEKPVLITFDDGLKEQYSIGARVLEKYNFKGVFFIMTVTIDKQNYMSQSEIKALSDKGHIIGCHTWDHHRITDYKKDDWTIQLSKPKQQLEKITQKPVTSFAYPYGVWNHAAVDSVKKRGYATAYIVYGKSDASVPLYTIKRIIVTNSGGIKQFLNLLERNSTNN